MLTVKSLKKIRKIKKKIKSTFEIKFDDNVNIHRNMILKFVTFCQTHFLKIEIYLNLNVFS